MLITKKSILIEFWFRFRSIPILTHSWSKLPHYAFYDFVIYVGPKFDIKLQFDLNSISIWISYPIRWLIQFGPIQYLIEAQLLYDDVFGHRVSYLEYLKTLVSHTTITLPLFISTMMVLIYKLIMTPEIMMVRTIWDIWDIRSTQWDLVDFIYTQMT